jgi:hypothetical protein
VGQEWGSRDEEPSVPPCPEKPGSLTACSARAFAIGLEKRRRYARAIGNHDGVGALSFSARTATVIGTSSGFIASARLYFAVEPAAGTDTSGVTESVTPTPTEAGGTATPEYPTGLYYVHYLVTPDGQWRAGGYPDGFEAESALRQAGSPVACPDDA